jgi:L-lactate utilization protein LutB
MRAFIIVDGEIGKVANVKIDGYDAMAVSTRILSTCCKCTFIELKCPDSIPFHDVIVQHS